MDTYILSDLFPSCFATNTLYVSPFPSRASRSTHLIPFDVIILVIFDVCLTVRPWYISIFTVQTAKQSSAPEDVQIIAQNMLSCLKLLIKMSLLHLVGYRYYLHAIFVDGPPLWSSGQSFGLQIQRSRVRFPALPDFPSSSGSGTGSTQPREVN